MKLKKVKTYTYQEYFTLIKDLCEEGEVTGSIQSEERLVATKINLHRMNRIYKTVSIDSKIRELFEKYKDVELMFLVIVEGWCGDGAQNLPVIARISELTPNISLKIILRDENPKIMDQYLTNGSRAIPKLVCFENEDGIELGTWGPRPSAIKEKVEAYKKHHSIKENHDDFTRNLHTWYAQDKGRALQKDLYTCVEEWFIKSSDLLEA